MELGNGHYFDEVTDFMTRSGIFAVLVCIATAGLLTWVFWGEHADHDGSVASTSAQVDRASYQGKTAVSGLAAGWVTFRDKNGATVSRVRAAVVDGAWLALPANAAYGASSWTFVSDSGNREIPIRDGLWKESEPAGLWRLELSESSFASPLLFAWDSARQLDWQPIWGDFSPVFNVDVDEPLKKGLFLRASPEGIPEMPGLFLQDGNVVGWTFGPDLAGAFLWVDRGWEDPGFGATVESFYSQTFANGREDLIARVFAMEGNYSVIEKLSAAIEALYASPKLARGEAPAGLTLDRLEKHIRKLIATAIDQGLYAETARLVDVQLLQRLNDQNLLQGIAVARTQASGIEDGLRFLEEIAGYFPDLDPLVFQNLLEIRRALFRQALLKALERDDRAGAWRVYEEARTHFPDDAELHLVGVELALSEFGWQEADRLLNDMQYPQHLLDRVRLLAMEIDTGRRNEQRVVIRFQPGSNIVPVSAYINDALSHDFVIDTGASMVVIPSTALDRLGLTVGEDAPKHHIATAGGVRVARQVHLDSLEIEGWRETDIEALVLDIPGQPDLGLIGMNFLNRFQMDLKNDEGILFLTPVR